MSNNELSGYTGKKHKNYIWIPKPKSDLKEYRDILRLCKILEGQEGYFNDRTLGLAQVKKGAIFDGSLDAKDYIKKYEGKTIGNQSYISNARMSLRMARFFGWITRFPNEEAKYKLTARGLLLAKFMGKFPAQIGKINEFDVMFKDILGMRFYCVNDNPRYQNKLFKQRVMVNILRFLQSFEYLHNYEIVISALTLKSEHGSDLRKAYDRIERLRKGKINISEALKECDIDPNDKSSLTGVYDGPKVLCSFLKQLRLLEPVETSDLGKSCVRHYEKSYVGSLINNAPRNVFRITKDGQEVTTEKLGEIPIWYEDLPRPRDKYSAAIVLLKNNVLTEDKLNKLRIKNNFFNMLHQYNLVGRTEGLQGINSKVIDFEIHRDIPPEDYESVKNIIVHEEPELLEVKIDMRDILFIPKGVKKQKLCIKCHPPRCYVYEEFRDVPNSKDYLAYKLCPNDSLSRDYKTGNIIVDGNKCVSCMLCLFRCPVGAITFSGLTLNIAKIPAENNPNYEYVEDDIIKLEELTDQVVKQKAFRQIIENIDRVGIVRTFENKISPLEQNWSQDEFYVWVRNCFRMFNLTTMYTGGKGMKTRSDVTIVSPFPVAIEIKSPSEGKVTGKAIRQTDDAAAQLFQKFKRRVYMCAIGQEISPEAKRKADEHKKYQESYGIKNYCIPLIPSKSLLYLMLLNLDLSFGPTEVELIFKEFHGEFNNEEIKKYLGKINRYRTIAQLNTYLQEVDQIYS